MAPPSLSWLSTSLAERSRLGHLTFELLEKLASEAQQITVAAAYWDANFLDRLLTAVPVARRSQVFIRLFVNGFPGRRGEEQIHQLREISRRWRRRQFSHLSMNLINGSHLFHSKVFIFTDKNATHILVGSANATEAAFSHNEELMVMLRAADVPWELRRYIQAVAEKATALDQVPPYIASNLPAFFRGGDVYYRPTVVTSFRFDLRLPAKLRAAMAQLQEPIAGIIARAGQTYDPFAGVLTAEEQREHDAASNSEQEEPTRGRVPLSSYGVQTCYGWWVPNAYSAFLEKKLAPARARRKALLDRLEQLLGADGSKLRELAASRFEQLASYARRNGFPLEESKQRLTRFDEFLVRATDRLADPHWRQRAERPYIQAALPEIWNDPTSSAEFSDSFFGYLEFVATMRKQPAVWKTLLAAVPALSDAASSEEMKRALKNHLANEGWHQSAWESR